MISCECMIVDWLLLFFSSQRKQKYFDGSYKLDWNPRSSAGRYVRENCSPLKVRASSIHLFINQVPVCLIAFECCRGPPAFVQDNEYIILKIFIHIFLSMMNYTHPKLILEPAAEFDVTLLTINISALSQRLQFMTQNYFTLKISQDNNFTYR